MDIAAPSAISATIKVQERHSQTKQPDILSILPCHIPLINRPRPWYHKLKTNKIIHTKLVPVQGIRPHILLLPTFFVI